MDKDVKKLFLDSPFEPSDFNEKELKQIKEKGKVLPPKQTTIKLNLRDKNKNSH